MVYGMIFVRQQVWRGGGADGNKNGVASARGGHFGLLARAARGGTLAGSRPGFSKKKPEKIFLEICKLLL